jgi:hypothetical protein
VVRNRLGNHPAVFHNKIFTKNASPTRSPEFDLNHQPSSRIINDGVAILCANSAIKHTTPKPDFYALLSERTSGQTRIALFVNPFTQVRRDIIFQVGHIRAVSRQESLTHYVGSQDNAPRPGLLAICIYGTEKGSQIKFFTGNISVIDFSLIFDFFKTTTATLTTPVFPITRSLHDNSLFSGKIQGAVFQEDINTSEGAVPGQQMKSAFRSNFDAFAKTS